MFWGKPMACYAYRNWQIQLLHGSAETLLAGTARFKECELIMYNDPEWASAEEWDAYAWFGFAIAEAQAIERQLLVIAVALKAAEDPLQFSDERWFQLYDELGGLTLGRLLRQVRPYGVLPEDVVGALDEAVVIRNKLAHEFFWPRPPDVFTEKPPFVAQEELKSAASHFSNLSSRLESAIWLLLERLHVARASIDQEVARVINSAPQKGAG